MRDLLGQKFGLLTVIGYEGSTGYQHRWNCLCDCGNKATVQANHLISKNTKSCGCLHKRSGKDSPFFKGYGEIPLDVFSVIKRGAIGGGKLHRKSKEFAITIEYIWDLFLKQNRKCALTGLDLSLGGKGNDRKKKSSSTMTASLDRIDSNKGYIVGNVQWVHKDINFMKNDYDMAYFIKMCKLVASRGLDVL